MKIFAVLMGLLALSCDAKEVLRSHVAESFLQAHNSLRAAEKVSAVSWSRFLASQANLDSLRLSVLCWSNSISNGENANTMQVWGSYPYTPKTVLRRWMAKPTSKGVILYPHFRYVGCAYTACKDPGSYATAVIYVCRYSHNPDSF